MGLTGGRCSAASRSGAGVFERISREASGLTCWASSRKPEALTEPLGLKVRVKRPGLTVRTPQQVVPPPPLTKWPDQKRALGFTLRQPRPATELPMKVSAYTVRGSANLRLKTVIAAELALPVGRAADWPGASRFATRAASSPTPSITGCLTARRRPPTG